MNNEYENTHHSINDTQSPVIVSQNATEFHGALVKRLKSFRDDPVFIHSPSGCVSSLKKGLYAFMYINIYIPEKKKRRCQAERLM